MKFDPPNMSVDMQMDFERRQIIWKDDECFIPSIECEHANGFERRQIIWIDDEYFIYACR